MKWWHFLLNENLLRGLKNNILSSRPENELNMPMWNHWFLNSIDSRYRQNSSVNSMFHPNILLRPWNISWQDLKYSLFVHGFLSLQSKYSTSLCSGWRLSWCGHHWKHKIEIPSAISMSSFNPFLFQTMNREYAFYIRIDTNHCKTLD